MFCAQCGTPIPDDAGFCPNCGLKTIRTAAAETMTAQSAPQPESPPIQYRKAVQPGNKKLIIVLAVMIGLIMTAIVVLAFVLIGKFGPDKNPIETTRKMAVTTTAEENPTTTTNETTTVSEQTTAAITTVPETTVTTTPPTTMIETTIPYIIDPYLATIPENIMAMADPALTLGSYAGTLDATIFFTVYNLDKVYGYADEQAYIDALIASDGLSQACSVQIDVANGYVDIYADHPIADEDGYITYFAPVDMSDGVFTLEEMDVLDDNSSQYYLEQLVMTNNNGLPGMYMFQYIQFDNLDGSQSYMEMLIVTNDLVS